MTLGLSDVRTFGRMAARAAFTSLACAVLCCSAVNASRPRDQDREPMAAGQFYPQSPSMLKAAVQAMLDRAVVPRADRPVGIVVPHAGYIYSGQIAADAYRQAAAHRYDTVVIVGTNHTSASFRKVAVWPGKTYRTPLGAAAVDEALAADLMKADPDCVVDAEPHRAEHSVEVQVPFVQVAFPSAKVLPLVVGRPDDAMCARLGRALAAIVKNRSVLLVASSDLSHYPSAADAGRVDRRTLETIASLDVAGLHQSEVRAGLSRTGSDGESQEPRVPELATRACGAGPVMAVMTAAQALGALRGIVLSYANSGDTSVGEPNRVVGYGAVSFVAGDRGGDVAALKAAARDDSPLDAQDKKALLAFARETIRRYLATETTPLARGFAPRVYRNRGVFVTLKAHGNLRGCIGHIAGDQSMPRLVGAMALQSAFNDPRFDKVRAEELSRLEIEISILSPPKPVGGPSDIVVGRDGVFLSADGRGAVFLPQVAPEQGWNRDQMLDALCEKAGLPANRWRRPGVSYSTFQAEVFGEK